MSPAALPPHVPVDTRPYGFWRDGDLLAVRSGSTLPNRCVDTGAATPLIPVRLRIGWTPRWALAAGLLFPVIGTLLSRAARRDVELTVSATPQVHAQRRAAQFRGKALQWLPLLAFVTGIGLFAAGLGSAGIVLIFGSFLSATLIISLGAWIVARNRLARVDRVVDGVAYLRVGEGFWSGLQTWQPGPATAVAAPAHSPFA